MPTKTKLRKKAFKMFSIPGNTPADAGFVAGNQGR